MKHGRQVYAKARHGFAGSAKIVAFARIPASHDLFRQRDFQDAAGRRRPRRPRGGVLPVRGLQSLTGRESDRASAACTFCDTDFIGTDGEGGGSSPRRRRWPTPSPRPGAPARNGATWSSPAASRCCSWTRPCWPRCTRAASRWPSRPTARCPRQPASIDLRQPQGHAACGAGTRQRTQAGLSASQCAARTLRAPGFRAFLPATWTVPPAWRIPNRPSNTVRSIRNGGSACKRINT